MKALARAPTAQAMSNSLRHPIGKRTAAAVKVAARRIAADFVTSLMAVAVTNTLLYGSVYRHDEEWVYLTAGLASIAASLALRLYRISARYMNAREVIYPVAAAGLVAAAVGIVHVKLIYIGRMPLPVTYPLIFFVFLLGAWLLSRAVVRYYADHSTYQTTEKRSSQRVMIVGAGDAGSLAVRELQRMVRKRPILVGLVDDDDAKQGMMVHGVPVLGRVEDLPALTKRMRIDEVLIAIPSASGEQMRRIVDVCDSVGVRLRTLPSFEDLISGRKPIMGMARKVQVEDLLRRKSLHNEVTSELDYLKGQCVLISGGGGSIGGELARVVARYAPSCLVLFGKGENSIFEIDQELKQLGHSMVVPFVGDVRDPQSVANAFDRFKPSIVFHAAAHKHVPMMEAVPIEAIRNNIFGTVNMAEAALRQGCRKFILVSTDKAVNPSNVMGASKRVAEMVVGAYAGRGETDFAAVRFGNVLGSRGSLIPILTKQIEQGGPITITHPDMTRFCMTIPEAANLILQAGSLGSRGDIFILDMGEPVKIMDIAMDLVRLNNLEPGRDIELKFIGIRPGEKMHEELSWGAEDVVDSGVPKVMRVVAKSHVGWDWLRHQLTELDRVCQTNDSQKARAMLLDLAWGNTLPPSHFAGQLDGGNRQSEG